MVELTVRGNERLYAVQPDRWQAVLQIDPERFPSYRDWPHALQALRVLHRWLHQPDLETFSPYMRASEARALMDRIEPVLRYAGVLVTLRNATGEEYWDVFTEAIEQILGHLASGLPW